MIPPFPSLLLQAYEAAWANLHAHPAVIGAAGIALASLCAAAAFAKPIASENPGQEHRFESRNGE